MFCSKCGIENDGLAKFCCKCGQEMLTGTVNEVSKPIVKRNIKVILISVFLVGIVGVGGWLYFQKAAEREAKEQVSLGRKYQDGEGVPKDYDKALELFRKAADRGYADAQINVGYMYVNGLGVKQNYGIGLEWYLKASEQGEAVAQTNIADIYRRGLGVPKDYGKALEWYRKAAAQGDAFAQAGIGSMYVKGQGVPKDYGKALELFQKAADQGDANGQHELGEMYASGRGVAKDDAKAAEWYGKAAEQGNNVEQRFYIGDKTASVITDPGTVQTIPYRLVDVDSAEKNTDIVDLQLATLNRRAIGKPVLISVRQCYAPEVRDGLPTVLCEGGYGGDYYVVGNEQDRSRLLHLNGGQLNRFQRGLIVGIVRGSYGNTTMVEIW